MKNTLLKAIGLLTVLILSVSMLGACDSSENESEETTTPTNEETTVVEDEVSTKIVVTDQTGRVVTLDGIPEKIVSIAPSNTEIIYSLGLEDKLVGVTDYCNYPEAALDKPKVGGYSTVDVEKLTAAEPDVIFGTNIHIDEVLPSLEELGLTVIILDPKTIDEVLESFTIIGKATGTEEKAAEIVADLETRIEAITDVTDTLTNAEKPSVFYVMWHEPLMTVGGDTRISEMIEKAGGINIFSDTEGYPTIDLETLVEANPQVIIAGTGMGEGADAPFTFAKEEERLDGSDARLNGMIYEINTDLTGRPSERMIDGFEQIAKMIHPDLFE